VGVGIYHEEKESFLTILLRKKRPLRGRMLQKKKPRTKESQKGGRRSF